MANLVSLKNEGKLVFVGDTHGDLEASKIVIERYLKPGHVIVFLGDYVDRGDDSIANIDFLVMMREKYPKQIYLLLGNHDAWSKCRCYPADFWEGLDASQRTKYSEIFGRFPLILVCGSIIACHGGLPDLKSLDDIEKIEECGNDWMKILWGDFADTKGEILDDGSLNGRPIFGKDYFERVMENFGKKVLVRGHQSDAKENMFGGRCLTIFTSRHYPRRRVVAIADMTKEIESSADLEIVEI